MKRAERTCILLTTSVKRKTMISNDFPTVLKVHEFLNYLEYPLFLAFKSTAKANFRNRSIFLYRHANFTKNWKIESLYFCDITVTFLDFLYSDSSFVLFPSYSISGTNASRSLLQALYPPLSCKGNMPSVRYCALVRPIYAIVKDILPNTPRLPFFFQVSSPPELSSRILCRRELSYTLPSFR